MTPGAAAAVAALPEPQRPGLAIFILANEPGTLTAKAIKACAKTLHRWPGLQMPLMAKHQTQRNVARALVRLWSGAVEAYPEDAYAAAAMFIYQEAHEEPWGSEEKTRLWFGALGGDTYFSGGRVNWTGEAYEALLAAWETQRDVEQTPSERERERDPGRDLRRPDTSHKDRLAGRRDTIGKILSDRSYRSRP